MTSKILVNAIDPEECRIAKVKDDKLDEFHIESAAREITHGNIYKGVISRVETEQNGMDFCQNTKFTATTFKTILQGTGL